MPRFTDGLEKLGFFDEDALPIAQAGTPHGAIAFTMFGATTEFRVRTLFTKEPETLAWIDGLDPGDVFWDIGANIGCYSLYAAKRGLAVHAFEPSPVNFWLLSRNAAVNGFQRMVTYPFALSDASGVAFWEPHIAAGAAQNQLMSAGKRSAVQTYTVDALSAQPGVEFPNHIKLDVDGIERVILEGGARTLCDDRVRSVMCEIDESNREETDRIRACLSSFGFGAPVTRHPPDFEESYYAPSFNYLFKK